MNYYEYKGLYIEHDFYGRGEWTVQYCGDNVTFFTEQEARDFVDEVTG